jgi:hypothetical protein
MLSKIVDENRARSGPGLCESNDARVSRSSRV